ncbi:hypothetical protein COLO4_03659 [Corchorus olitorius]|uniref:Uncharacterized protein n=1 Tax=Corchorus olitorius TaxID=93759 RepID=A0A1R3KXU0_9ROSI|nr:hypothetical protein COLO4_03659 [Corchorus olitorius]
MKSHGKEKEREEQAPIIWGRIGVESSEIDRCATKTVASFENLTCRFMLTRMRFGTRLVGQCGERAG